MVKENASATLIDIGDGVACLEFHTKMNSIDEGLTAMIFEACNIVEKDFVGMVVGNHGAAFSAGANVFTVLTASQLGQWDMIEKGVENLQNGNMRMKYLSKPVVSAPAGAAVGGGCEMAMHAARCLPNGETYMGLVEVGVGVIPAGGGCKELLLRLTEGLPDGVVEAGLNMQYHAAKAFENIAMAKVSTSAAEAMGDSTRHVDAPAPRAHLAALPRETSPTALGPAIPDTLPFFWRTRAERTQWRETADYDETMRYCRQLEAGSRWVRLVTYGTRGQGRDLPMLIVSRDRAFTPEAARATGKPIVLVQNGIHSGEIEGKDACLALVRDMAVLRTRESLLDSCIVLVLPIYSVDAHEQKDPHNRINPPTAGIAPRRRQH